MQAAPQSGSLVPKDWHMLSLVQLVAVRVLA